MHLQRNHSAYRQNLFGVNSTLVGGEEDIGHGVDALCGTLEKLVRRPVRTPDLGLAFVGGCVDFDTGDTRHVCCCC